MSSNVTPLQALRVVAAVVPSLLADSEVSALAIRTLASGVEVRVEFDDGPTFVLPLEGAEQPVFEQALHLFRELQDWVAELPGAWGQARPACPGHEHPRRLVCRDDGLWWECPQGDPAATEKAFPALW